MTAERDQQLIDSARTGDLARVQRLLAAGADWHAQKEEALYQALQNGHMETTAKALLVTLLEAKIAATGGKMSDTMEVNYLRATLNTMPPLQLISFAMRHQSEGLFRHLLDKHPEELLEQGLTYCQIGKQYHFVKPLLDAGADVQRASGEWFYRLICEGEMETVREMIRHGIDVNKTFSPSYGECRHPLQAAATLADPLLRESFYDLLIAAGADLRVQNGAVVKEMVRCGLTEVFELYDRFDPGSEMMAVYGYSRSIFAAPDIQAEALKRFPFLKSWIDRDLIAPLSCDEDEVFQNWLDRLTPDDLTADDGFVMKLAVASPRPNIAILDMLEMGGLLNTQKDPPLKIAALLGKAELIGLLAEYGADIYAAHAVTLRGMDKVYQDDVIAALMAQVESTAEVSARILAAEFPGAPDPATLRRLSRDTIGDTGLTLAAKAGLFQPQAGITAEDFLQETAHQTTTAAILAARGEYDLLFSPKIWSGDMQGVEKVWAALRPDEQKQAAPCYRHLLENRSTAGKQQRLKELSRGNKFKLGPS